jgi:1-hydroxycarotenoid 3,4-desaturase
VLERQPGIGGKLRESRIGDAAIDAGPTVFTMRWVFEELFAAAGTSLAAHITLRPARILARHAWNAGEILDLHADLDQSAEAIGQFAGPAEARAFRAFSARAAKIYTTLEKPFLRAPLPTPLGLVRAAGLPDMLGIAPFDTMMKALGKHFADPRLRQLFGRYATYCGSSPYLAPATLMLVAHVERDGVWLVEGGMHRLAVTLAALATARGATIRTSAEITRIECAANRATAVHLGSGERIAADAVILNADPSSLPSGLFGPAPSRATPAIAPAARSLSALTWAMRTTTQGFPLSRHNVFFSADYPAEFNDIFARRRLPENPTIYICAQDRADDDAAPAGAERLLILVNAPPIGDTRIFTESEIQQCQDRTLSKLAACGLHLRPIPEATVTTAPHQFNALFPATGGALYGPAVHGPMATFKRPPSRTRIANLYLAGGATHPGAGVPMAALSGRLAAARLIADGASTNQ